MPSWSPPSLAIFVPARTWRAALICRLSYHEEQLEISETTLWNMGELFVRHDAHDAFAIHLLYVHFQSLKAVSHMGSKSRF